MALTYSVFKELGRKAPDFSLPGVDGKIYSLASFQNSKALVVIFMCNHCPYVVAVQDRINALAKEYRGRGISVVGINSNDTIKYPQDNFEAMKQRAKEKGYVFPYLWDETQQIAKAYDAVCTPDLYVFENMTKGVGDKGAGAHQAGPEFILRYHGRLDDNWKEPEKVTQRELALALDAILEGRPVSMDQKASMGCNIKWK